MQEGSWLPGKGLSKSSSCPVRVTERYVNSSLPVCTLQAWWPNSEVRPLSWGQVEGCMQKTLDQCSSYIHKLNILKLQSFYNYLSPLPGHPRGGKGKDIRKPH